MSENEIQTTNNAVANQPSVEERALLARLRQNSGEGLKVGNFKYVSCNGKTGKFTFGSKDEKGKATKTEIGNTYKGIVLKIRKRVNAFDGKDPTRTFSSDEFDDMNNEPIKVFNGLKQLVGDGSYRDLKKTVSGISMENVLYIKEEGEDRVVKLSVGGASLSKWFDYLKTFEAWDTSARYETIFGTTLAKHDVFGEYYQMTFERGKQENLEECIKLQDSLNYALNLMKNKDSVIQGETMHADQADYPERPDDIKVEEIPF
jgi:hypothetical protein